MNKIKPLAQKFLNRFKNKRRYNMNNLVLENSPNAKELNKKNRFHNFSEVMQKELNIRTEEKNKYSKNVGIDFFFIKKERKPAAKSKFEKLTNERKKVHRVNFDLNKSILPSISNLEELALEDQNIEKNLGNNSKRHSTILKEKSVSENMRQKLSYNSFDSLGSLQLLDESSGSFTKKINGETKSKLKPKPKQNFVSIIKKAISQNKNRFSDHTHLISLFHKNNDINEGSLQIKKKKLSNKRNKDLVASLSLKIKQNSLEKHKDFRLKANDISKKPDFTSKINKNQNIRFKKLIKKIKKIQNMQLLNSKKVKDFLRIDILKFIAKEQDPIIAEEFLKDINKNFLRGLMERQRKAYNSATRQLNNEQLIKIEGLNKNRKYLQKNYNRKFEIELEKDIDDIFSLEENDSKSPSFIAFMYHKILMIGQKIL